MIRTSKVLFLPAIILSICGSGSVACSQDIGLAADQTELRKWTSHDGSESILASLESFDKKSKLVSLRNQQGEIVEVRITLLSPTDRRYVSKSSKKKSPSVFKKTDRAPANSPAIESETESTDAKRTQRAKVVKRYGIDWTVGVEEALANASSGEQRRPVMLFRVLGELGGFM